MLACHQALDGHLLLDCGHQHLLLQPVEPEGHGEGEVVAKKCQDVNIIVGYMVFMIMFNSCALLGEF